MPTQLDPLGAWHGVSATIPPIEKYAKYRHHNPHRMRPVTFRPDGSFRSLAQRGKLPTNVIAHSGKQFEKAHYPKDRKSIIPGYTGYIRGSQHISGRTYGNTTHTALTQNYRQILRGNSCPPEPNKNLKIQQRSPKDTYITNHFHGKQYHLPGYTGFVPGQRKKFGKTFGSATSDGLFQHTMKHPRAPSQQKEGFAQTHRPRLQRELYSVPVPGTTYIDRAPEKLVPAHLASVKYMAY